MKHLLIAPFLSALLLANVAFAQINRHNRSDTLKNLLPNFDGAKVAQASKGTLKCAYKVPLILVACGLFSVTDNDIFSRVEIHEELDEWVPNFNHHADDYLQHVPILAVYGLNLIGVKGKNNFGNRTALLIKSEFIVTTLTFFFKKATDVPRPDDPMARTSFPSGHTAQAFATATVFSKEYGQRSIWYSIGAYGVATTVGAMRMLNNRHWASDVLVGAGLGIFSANLAYLTHQYKWGRVKKPGQTAIVPSFDGQAYMLRIVLGFN